MMASRWLRLGGSGRSSRHPSSVSRFGFAEAPPAEPCGP